MLKHAIKYPDNSTLWHAAPKMLCFPGSAGMAYTFAPSKRPLDKASGYFNGENNNEPMELGYAVFRQFPKFRKFQKCEMSGL